MTQRFNPASLQRSSLYAAGTLLVAFLLGACQQPATPVPYIATHNTHEIMTWVLDPAADHLWASAGQIITEAETVDLAPTTDEGWSAVRASAIHRSAALRKGGHAKRGHRPHS